VLDRDVMMSEAVSVSAETPLPDIAALMLDRMVRRVVVTRRDLVVGIVSASDVMRAPLALRGNPPECSRHRRRKSRLA